ncbi:MAG: PASTA domain-containing protein, partial [Clostridia bacterium]|nr:PASTA domain-containing protein [Clostridia bacterium]
MKFHFTKRTVTRPNVKSTRRPIFKRTHNSIDSFRAITRNEEIDLFGTFDDRGGQKGSSLFVPIKRVLVKAYTRLKGIFKKSSDRRRKASTRASLILGAICGVLSVSLVSGVITVFALFGVYEGKYTSITVPDLTSLSLDEATAIQSDSFEYETVYRYNPDKKVGSVIFQSPRAGVSRKLYKNGEKIKMTLFINSDTPT